MSVLLFLSLLRWKLWRWKRLSPWLVRYPDLTGTWRGYSESGFFGEELDGHFVGDRIGLVLTVDQQFDRITFKAYHPDSWNNGISSCFDGSAAAYRMFVVYKNHTSSQHDPNASDHLGCFVFDLHDIGMDRGRWHIEGRYWTDKERPRGTGSRDRGTHGKIAASWWKKPILSKAEAQPEAKRYLHDTSSVRGDPALTRAASAPSGPTGTLPREGAQGPPCKTKNTPATLLSLGTQAPWRPPYRLCSRGSPRACSACANSFSTDVAGSIPATPCLRPPKPSHPASPIQGQCGDVTGHRACRLTVR